MASSDVEVCNIALQLLGAKPITSLTEGSDRASLCNQFYATARDAALRLHPWNFAQVRITLARESVTPAYGFLYQYQLPTQPLCLRVLATNPDDADYAIEAGPLGVGRKLLTDEPTLSIKYTAQITDPTQFDAAFVKVMAAELAAMMALPLTESPATMDAMQKHKMYCLSEARSIDSQEGSTQRMDVNTLVDVRLQGFQEFSRNNKVI